MRSVRKPLCLAELHAKSRRDDGSHGVRKLV